MEEEVMRTAVPACGVGHRVAYLQRVCCTQGPASLQDGGGARGEGGDHDSTKSLWAVRCEALELCVDFSMLLLSSTPSAPSSPAARQ